MRLHKHILLLLSLYLIFANSLPHQIFKNLHETHTPDIVIVPKQPVEDDSVLLLRAGESQYRKDFIEDTAVADLVSHLLSSQPLTQNSRSALPSVDPFEKPQANLLITIESAGEETMDVKSFEGAQKLKLKKSSSHFELGSFLETISTGETSEVHGVSAFRPSSLASTPSSSSLLTNFADVLSQTTDGNSLSLSLSSSLSASALAPHIFEPHANSALLSFNSTIMEVEGQGNSALHFKQKKDQLLRVLAKLPYVSYVTQKNAFTITLPNAQPVLFDLHKQEDLLFAMEISMSELLAEKLKKAEDLKLLVGDQYPDSLAIVFTSLRSLGASKQDKLNVARAFLMNHVNSLIERINTTYSQRLSSQVLLTGSPRPSSFAALSQILPSYIEKEYLPYVYTKEGEYEKVCRELRSGLEETEFEARCLHEEESRLRKRQTSSSDDADDLLYFQSIFWGIIGWLLAIFLIVRAMASINSGKDSLLYRSSVQSRHPHSQ